MTEAEALLLAFWHGLVPAVFFQGHAAGADFPRALLSPVTGAPGETFSHTAEVWFRGEGAQAERAVFLAEAERRTAGGLRLRGKRCRVLLFPVSRELLSDRVHPGLFGARLTFRACIC